MTVEESVAQYRYWGIEIRIVFVLVATIFFLLAIFNFFHNPVRSLVYLVITILVVLAIRLDYNHHLISMNEKSITFKKIRWAKMGTKSLSLKWSDVDYIATQRFGFFDLLKKTEIVSKQGQTISVFSFMEDYFHFLNDIVRWGKNANIDKLTQDLIAGRAEL